MPLSLLILLVAFSPMESQDLSDQIMAQVVERARVNNTELRNLRFLGSEIEVDFRSKRVKTLDVCVKFENNSRVEREKSCSGSIRKPSDFEIDIINTLSNKYRYRLINESESTWVIAFEPKSNNLEVTTKGDHGANRLRGTLVIDKEYLYIKELFARSIPFRVRVVAKIEELEIRFSQIRVGNVFFMNHIYTRAKGGPSLTIGGLGKYDKEIFRTYRIYQ